MRPRSTCRSDYVALVPDRLLFVTQVAPYADGPAGVHGVLDQAAVGVGQVAELHGLRPQRVDDVRELNGFDIVEARALALFTIGETPWSEEQRDAILDGVRSGRLSVVSIHSATDSCYGWSEYGSLVGARFDGHPWTQTFVADVLDTDASGVCAPRHRVEMARRGVPVPRSAPRRPGAAPRARRRARPHGARARARPTFGYPLAWCFSEGAGRVFSTSLGHFPGAWETPAYLRHLSGGLGWALGDPA